MLRQKGVRVREAQVGAPIWGPMTTLDGMTTVDGRNHFDVTSTARTSSSSSLGIIAQTQQHSQSDSSSTLPHVSSTIKNNTARNVEKAESLKHKETVERQPGYRFQTHVVGVTGASGENQQHSQSDRSSTFHHVSSTIKNKTARNAEKAKNLKHKETAERHPVMVYRWEIAFGKCFFRVYLSCFRLIR